MLGTVVTVLVSGSFIAGKLIETNYNQVVEQLNGQNPPVLNILTYKRGVFSSDVELAYDLGGEKLVLVQSIKHGPLMIGITPRGFRINLGLARVETTPKTELESKLYVTTVIGFTKSATSYLSLKNLTEPEQDNLRISWDTVYGEFKHDLAFSRLSGELRAPAVSVTTDKWQMALQDFNYQINQGKLAPGQQTESLSLASLSFARNGTELINLSSATIAKNSIINPAAGNDDNASLNYSVLGNVGHAKVAQQEFTNEQFEFMANNLAYNVNTPMTNMLTLLVNPRALVASAKSLSQDAGAVDLKLEFPKKFSEALLAYLSFEIYRTSPLGQVDKRPEQVVLKDISASVNGLLREALKKKIILERGSNYALNFNMVKR